MPNDRYTARIVLFNRRELLKAGGVGLVGGVVLAGCDTLELPPVELLDALPDQQTAEEFYVQSAFGTPDVDAGSHELVVRDGGTELARFDLAWLEGLPSREREHSLQCIGANPRFLFVGNAIWEGLPFSEILDELGVAPSAQRAWIKFTGADDYTTAIPISDLTGTAGRDPIWLVWRMDGEPLTRAHGKPFRFLVPGRYGTKNPKWPSEVDFVTDEYLGHWEQRGWSQLAEFQTNGLILSPPSMAVLPEGSVRIVGTAFKGHTEVVAVDVTVDGGSSWEAAEITYDPSQSTINPGGHIWTTWRYDFVPPGVGEYTVQVRVETADGVVSELDTAGTDRLNGYNAGMAIDLRID